MMGKNKRNASWQAVIAAVLALSTACGLGILDEREFEFAYKGPPTVIIDDFETNDGFMSTKYLYEPEREEDEYGWSDDIARVSMQWAYSGDYSLFLGTDVDLKVDLPMDLQLSYVTQESYYNSDADQLCYISALDGYEYYPVNSYVEIIKDVDNWDRVYKVYYTIPAGIHTITLGSEYFNSPRYIDDLSIGEYLPRYPTIDSPTLLSPAFAYLDWEDVPDASSYAFQASEDADFSTLVADATGLSSSSYTIPSTVDFTSLYCRYGVAGLAEDTVWYRPFKVVRAYSGETETFDDDDIDERWFFDPNEPPSCSISVYDYEGHSSSPSLKIYANEPDTIYHYSYCKTRVYLETEGTVSFYYRADYSGNSYDFYVDDVLRGSLATTTWTYQSVFLDAGYHDLRFTANNYYCGLYIDDLVVP